MRKKALIFIEDGSFSYDNRVIRETKALLDDGWEITVISPKYPEDPFYKKINENLRAYYYPKPNAVSAFGHLFEHSISLLLGSVLTCWVKFRHGFQVFQGCNPMDILWLIALPYKLSGSSFIFDQHDLCPELYLSRVKNGHHSFYYRILKILEKLSYRFADIVMATNQSYKDTAIERGGKKPDNVFIVRNGPDLKKFKKTKPQTGLKKENEILVGYLGNMNIQDGVDYLLFAAKEVLKKHNRGDIKFVLVGGGSYQPFLCNKAKEMGLSNNIIFTGRIPDQQMLSVLNACDICVQPDPYNPLNDKSTMNKVLEYMALEKPLISFDLKETRVSCGEAAIYVKPNDINELAEKILLLADNHQLREKMASAGRERVEIKMSWEYSIPHLLNAYQKALEK